MIILRELTKQEKTAIRAERTREYRERNKERLREYERKRYAKNREKMIEKSRKYHEEHREQIRKRDRLYRRHYRLTHPGYYDKQYYETLEKLFGKRRKRFQLKIKTQKKMNTQERKDLRQAMAEEFPTIRKHLDENFDLKKSNKDKDAFIIFLEDEVERLLRLIESLYKEKRK